MAKSTSRKLEPRLLHASAAMKKQFTEVRRKIAKLRAQGSASFDELYEEIGDILDSDPPLYVAGGYRTKEAFIAAELPGETLRSVSRNVLVARCFTPADEARHGINFLEEAAAFAREQAGADEAPRAIDLDRLKIPLNGGRKAARKATILELRRARRALRKGQGSARSASPTELALRRALDRLARLRNVTVRTSATVASFGNVPLPELAAFARVLAKLKLPG